jgi:hypothetical protein
LLLSLLQLAHESSKLFRKGFIEGSLIPRLETTSDLGGKLGVNDLHEGGVTSGGVGPREEVRDG